MLKLIYVVYYFGGRAFRARLVCSGIQHISNACMQDTFARARTRPSARATIRYLVYKSNAQGTDPSKSVSLFNAFEIAICQDIFYKYMVVVVSSQFISCQHIFLLLYAR